MLKAIKYYIQYFINILWHGLFSIFINRKKFKLFSSKVNEFGINYCLETKATRIIEKDLSEIVADHDLKIVMKNLPWRQGNVTFYELFCISVISSNKNPHNVIEIGTFDGRTTLHIALNTPENTVIHTIDLPPEDEVATRHRLDEGDLQLIQKKFQTGYLFRGTCAEKKIVQHFSDSAKFDFGVFSESVDLFFIDGAHSYDYIKSDTQNALKAVKQGGIILWHDYGNIIDVTDYLNDLTKTIPLVKIKNTSLVMYCNGK